MSGRRYLLDTNAIVALLRGNGPVLSALRSAEWVGISIISQLEFLAFAGLTDADREQFQRLLDRIEVIGLESGQSDLLARTVEVRQAYRVKLPDAIIAATALVTGSTLMTADAEFRKVAILDIMPL